MNLAACSAMEYRLCASASLSVTWEQSSSGAGGCLASAVPGSQLSPLFFLDVSFSSLRTSARQVAAFV